MPDYEQVSYNSVDGAQMGNSSSRLIGFLGATPTTLSTITVAATAPVSTSGIFGFTSAQAVGILAVCTELQRKGLIGTGA